MTDAPDALAAENARLMIAVRDMLQRLNETGAGEMGWIDTIHAAHAIGVAALSDAPSDLVWVGWSLPRADALKLHYEIGLWMDREASTHASMVALKQRAGIDDGGVDDEARCAWWREMLAKIRSDA